MEKVPRGNRNDTAERAERLLRKVRDRIVWLIQLYILILQLY